MSVASATPANQLYLGGSSRLVGRTGLWGIRARQLPLYYGYLRSTSNSSQTISSFFIPTLNLPSSESGL